MRIRYILPLLSIMLLSSCSEDDNSLDLSSQNASDQISEIADDMGDNVVTLVESEGVDAALALVDLVENSTEFGRISPYQAAANQAYVTQQAEKLAHYFVYGVADVLGEEPADFVDYKGVYDWNSEIGDFERVGESEFIVINFPAEGSTTNNAQFRLTEFTVVVIDEEELPTTIKADLSVDDVKFIGLDFVVDYAADGNPEAADIFLDVLPFSLDIRFDDTQSTSSELAATLLLEGENLMGVDVSVDFSTEYKLEPTAISGEVFYKDLRIVGSVNNGDLDDSVDGDPNDYIDLDIFIGDDKAGDIVFIEEEVDYDGFIELDYVPYLEYADGSREKLEDILEEVIADLEATFDDLG